MLAGTVVDGRFEWRVHEWRALQVSYPCATAGRIFQPDETEINKMIFRRCIQPQGIGRWLIATKVGPQQGGRLVTGNKCVRDRIRVHKPGHGLGLQIPC